MQLMGTTPTHLHNSAPGVIDDKNCQPPYYSLRFSRVGNKGPLWAAEVKMPKIKGSLYLEYDLTWFLTFKNGERHGLQGTAELPFLAISTCLLIKKEKMSTYCECMGVTYGFII